MLVDDDLEISSIDLEMFNIKVGFTASDEELPVSDIFSLEFILTY